MPKDIFGDMFSYFMYFMGIIIAVMLILMRVDAVSTSYVSDMAVSFVDECRTTGEISADNYQKTYEHICRTGSYDVSLSYDSAVAFPTDTHPRRDLGRGKRHLRRHLCHYAVR